MTSLSNEYKRKVIIDFAQSSVSDGLLGRNNMKFSTVDADNDITTERHCADLTGGGFWFGFCLTNGLSVTGSADNFGWKSAFGTYLLQEAEMYVCQ